MSTTRDPALIDVANSGSSTTRWTIAELGNMRTTVSDAAASPSDPAIGMPACAAPSRASPETS
jgi:hypothetical protein